MNYISMFIQILVMLIGIYMMYNFPNTSNPPFISGLAIFLIGLYLALQQNYWDRGLRK